MLIVIQPSHVHPEEEVSAQVITLTSPNKTNENVDTESICVITVWIRRVMVNGRNNHELQMSELGLARFLSFIFLVPRQVLCSALLLNRLM